MVPSHLKVVCNRLSKVVSLCLLDSPEDKPLWVCLLVCLHKEKILMRSNDTVSGQNRVGPGYPDMGTIQPSHMGSGSKSPTKLDNYTDTNMNVPPIDKG